MTIRRVLALAVTGIVVSPLAAYAGDQPWQMASDYAALLHSDSGKQAGASAAPSFLPPASSNELQTVLPAAGSQSEDGSKSPGPPVLSLDAGGSASRIHGFADFRIATQYITPRGLVAEKSSPQFQALFGLVFDVYHGDSVINDVSLIGGTWGDYNAHPDKTIVTGGDVWVEQDIFAGFDVKFLNKWDAAYTIQVWTFPDLTSGHNELDPTPEYNMDLKISFDDTEYLKDFALHPYMDVFWNFTGGDSPVVAQALLGKNDNTFYVEMGITPSYTLKAITDLPITFTFPTYFSVGDSSFWGETPPPDGQRSNLGIFTTGMKISVPLKFIPAEFGNWNTYVGVTYFHTCNPALSYVNSVLQDAGDSHEHFLGYAGVGFSF